MKKAKVVISLILILILLPFALSACSEEDEVTNSYSREDVDALIAELNVAIANKTAANEVEISVLKSESASKIIELQSKGESLKSKMEALTLSYVEKAAELSLKSAENADALAALNERYEIEFSDLHSKDADLTEAINVLEAKIAEICDAPITDGALAELKKKYDEELAELKASDSENKIKIESLSSNFNASVAELNAENDKISKELAELKSNYDSNIEALETDVTKIYAEISKIQDELVSKITELTNTFNSEILSLKSQISEFDSKQIYTKEEIDSALSKLEAANKATADALAALEKQNNGVQELTLQFVSGAASSQGGGIGHNMRRIRTDYIPVQDLYLKPESDVKYAIYYYDSDKIYLGYVDSQSEARLLKENIPAETKYFIVVLRDAYDSDTDLRLRVEEYAKKFHAFLPTSTEYISYLSQVILNQEITQVQPEYVSDVPENIGVLNAILNMKQLVEAKYTLLEDMPHLLGAFEAGTSRKGIPYSSTRPENLFVPNNVSFHTFFTALQNPNSYLYTVDLGETGNINGDTYYGAVCSTAAGYALGIEPIYTTHQWTSIPGMELIENQSAYGLKLADTIVGQGHVVMITDITRDSRGRIGHITVSEASKPTVHSTNYTVEELEERFPPSKYSYCRYSKLYSVKHEASPYVPVEDEPRQDIVYNRDIIPRKGDKANWLYGTDVVLDVLTSDVYTAVEIYKNDSLLRTEDISDIITLSNLTYGSYKARLTDGNKTSDWCYWIVVDAVSEAAPTGTDTMVQVTFSASNATPIYIQWADGAHNGTVHISTLGEEEIEEGVAVCAYKSGNFKVRVAFKTEYGIIFSELPDAIFVN
ncbi:MAG: hypothetical protein IKB38_08880 [Clostridia bacterium]|nr:hypothetical protein [Clostridia bacterium]